MCYVTSKIHIEDLVNVTKYLYKDICVADKTETLATGQMRSPLLFKTYWNRIAEQLKEMMTEQNKDSGMKLYTDGQILMEGTKDES
jgi:hypothetical protein